MSTPRRRSRRARLLLSVLLGVAAFTLIGSAAAGTRLAPGSVTRAEAGQGQVGGDASTGRPAGRATGAAQVAAIPDARAALVGGAPPASGLTGYVWPLAHPRVTLPFGPTPWGEWIVDGRQVHDGMDLATFCGDRIVAAHDGTILAAGRHFDDAIGWIGDLTAYDARLDAKKLWTTLPIVVVIDDGNGYRSMYAHLGKIVVKAGDVVNAGQLLGYEGRTGHASGCHLHYGLFSPFEPTAFTLAPAIVKRMKVPSAEIARIDPLVVFPAP